MSHRLPDDLRAPEQRPRNYRCIAVLAQHIVTEVLRPKRPPAPIVSFRFVYMACMAAYGGAELERFHRFIHALAHMLPEESENCACLSIFLLSIGDFVANVAASSLQGFVFCFLFLCRVFVSLFLFQLPLLLGCETPLPAGLRDEALFGSAPRFLPLLRAFFLRGGGGWGCEMRRDGTRRGEAR